MINFRVFWFKIPRVVRVPRVISMLACGDLEQRFQWARVVVQCLLQHFGRNRLNNTFLCNSAGSDSDFSGGAAAWEHAACMLEAAGQEHGLSFDLKPRTICESWLKKRLPNIHD